MVIYNVTTSLDKEIHDQWLQWMNKVHIPGMLATGKFSRAMMTRVLSSNGELTYSVQYTSPDRATLRQFYIEDEQRLERDKLQFKGRFESFKTELKIVSEH